MKYHKLTLLRHLERRNGIPFALFKCDCGKEKEINFYNVKHGKTKSCGCYRDSMIRAAVSNHTKEQNRAHKIWLGIKGRCEVKSNSSYKKYGAKGLTMCGSWSKSFSAFWDDMGKPKENETIDRIDNRKGYSKDNCRWASYTLQSRNRRRLIGCGKVKFRGVTWASDRKVYVARITVAGKTLSIYRGKSCVTAIHKRCKAEIAYFGFVSECY